MPYIRPAESKDLKDIEYICRMTAGPESRAIEEVGRKISLTYSTYYARAEKETCFVLDDNGTAVGYILCAPDYSKYVKDYRKNEVRELWKIDKMQSLTAYFLPLGYLPFKKKYPAHLHIDILDEYQGKGYGKEAMLQALEFIRSFPAGEAECCWLSYEPENEVAKKLYASVGFEEKLELYEEGQEIPAVLKL